MVFHRMVAKIPKIKQPEKLVPTSRTKLRIVHTSISFVSLAACFAYLYFFEALLQIGKPTQTPINLILISGELIKFAINRKALNVKAHFKGSDLPTSQNHPVVIRGPQNIRRFVQAIFLIASSVALAALVCILFGAPLFQNIDKTITLAVQLTTVSMLPLVLYLGPHGTMPYLFCDHFELTSKSQTGYLDLVHYNAVFALFGAWAASAVVPLDWDRPWQAYPVPNMCGALVGFFAGNVYSFVLALFGAYRKRVEPKKSV